MIQQTIVALFRSRQEAETARQQLEAAGIPATDVNLREGSLETAAAVHDSGASHEGGFLSWLFGAEPAEGDVEHYRSHVARGGAALSVRVEEQDLDRITALLEQHDLVAIEGAREYDAPADTTGAVRQGGDASSEDASREEVALPTAREELEVGKRQVMDAKAYRIRRYVIERPAEAQVALHDETVEIERRSGALGTGDQPFEEKVVEVVETHEEPVVSKRVAAGEEVVVRKQAKDRVETVRDTVRESRVEVDRAAAGDKPAQPRRPPSEADR